MQRAELFGLIARFTVREGCEEAFDRLTDKTVRQVHSEEPDTLVYACHQVQAAPQQRIFYELYRNRAAFDTHESKDYVRAFLREREALLTSTEVDFLTLDQAKGLPVTQEYA